ncbi:hypothetical protein H181DRAFT_02759 [Streptomyces sp. WMMB 714]|uniref:hypothetical protein n=1 Tax=Streptomyces sp. WMMB 714 TaxID=1286822 RepID=UPI000698EE01|nr:hypothetical protein [Streptomyces sp. WMMB 714]SCK33672.1 hypothetical protein H181DRAFT_02759 [Streptomyces sp. WMMB 714]
MRFRSALTLCVPALLVATAGAGCAGPLEAVENAKELKSDSRRIESNDDRSVIQLADGRWVEMRYRPGKGLTERHQRSTKGRWTTPRTIHRTKAGPCRGIKLRARGDTVAAIADFGHACREDQPPDWSVAVVSEGDLSQWESDVTEGTDGWPRARFLDGGVRFVDKWHDGTQTLLWTPDGGFDKRTVWDGVPKSFVGTWRATDGSHQVTFEQGGDKPPRVVITTSDGECEARGQVEAIADVVQLPLDMDEVRGKDPDAFCPPEHSSPKNYELKGGTLRLTTPVESTGGGGYRDKVLVTYERVN